MLSDTILGDNFRIETCRPSCLQMTKNKQTKKKRNFALFFPSTLSPPSASALYLSLFFGVMPCYIQIHSGPCVIL